MSKSKSHDKFDEKKVGNRCGKEKWARGVDKRVRKEGGRRWNDAGKQKKDRKENRKEIEKKKNARGGCTYENTK